MKSIKFNLLLTFITLTALISCNNKDSSELTIIDGFVLGEVEDSLKSQYNKLDIGYERFFTNREFGSLNEVEENMLSFHYTKIFDIGSYSINNGVTDHYGLYYPMKMEGSNNINGLTILLGHTGSSVLIDQGITNLSQETGIKYFDQNVRFDLINEVERMLKDKYGEPDEIVDSDIFYDIVGSNIMAYNTGGQMLGKELIWRTKSIDIRFFKGFDNYNVVYNDSNNNLEGYFYHFEDNNEAKKLKEKDVYTKAFPHILYQINRDGLKNIEVDEIKL